MPPRKLVTTATAAQLDEVGDLFDELVDKDSGCVTAKEMAAILPYTAGAATTDVQAMIDDMVARKASLGKKQFVRLVSKRMYGGAWNAYMEALENAPLAHVIVSMKRRKHLVHFANFYLAKGVAGAELVVPADTDIHQNVGRYFCLAIAPDQDHQVIASSTGLLGKASLDRTQSCHGLSPDKLLAAFFLSPGRHAKPSRVATAAVPTTTSASFLVAAGLSPTAADHPLWVEPIHM
ncbi:hypothetical protein DYB36_000627 [Aphanomyces astaci]|uniref:EF-hand domain-containing protein n=1 Tax=Aphanomyces astaci TaxID=112090 RepID=A0A397BC97_APHAT|nr:hypothetical protein DYB36_000627 [Aphanomyces astaci]